MIKIHSSIDNTNGQTPRKISSKGTSGAIPFIINTFRPIGGVITPMDTASKMITPNQIGSYPRLLTTKGKKIGTVNNTNAKASITQPSIK